MTRLNESAPTFVYRCYDADGELLYLGISSNVGRRMGEHRTKPWHRFCARLEVSEPMSARDALRLEYRLVRRMQPIFNVDANDHHRGQAYLAEHAPEESVALFDACRAALAGLTLPAAPKAVSA